MYEKDLVKQLGFSPKEKKSDIYSKQYSGGYTIEIDFTQKSINYGKDIQSESKTTQNFSQAENFVVLECVDRLLEKGYKPEHIVLEKTYPAGHGVTKRLDILVTQEDKTPYLMIECKTYGDEFEKELKNIKKDGGQLFSYFQQDKNAELLMLYTSKLENNKIIYENKIITIEDSYRQAGSVKDCYELWNKLSKDNGVFDEWVKPYCFESKALTINDLEDIKPDDSSFIFNRFLEILRHNVVSDKGNAFNRIFTLFLCKIYDEKVNEGTDHELGFQWFNGSFKHEGVQYDKDDHQSFQLRLTDLYKNGMYEFLEKVVTDFSETEFKNKYNALSEEHRTAILEDIRKIRLEKNNEFAIKDVYDEQSFNDNAVVVKEVVELLQGYKLRYTKKQQYLSDFFELLLTTGLKQESGQFFTPVPVAQFIIKSLPVDVIVEQKLSSSKLDNDTLLPYIMDYAAGSGHFVTEMMHIIQKLINSKNDKNYHQNVAKAIRKWQDDHFSWAMQYIYGVEKDYRLVKVGKVGCYLHGDGLANVIHSDGLARFTHPDYKGKLLYRDKNFNKDNKQFDIIVSNPPYSVSAFKNNARKYYGKDDFELYNSLTDNSSEIECLFVERTKQLLKDGGTAGIILPSSILSNEGIYTKARELILRHFEIIAITELGSNTFMATGTNTVVLFLRRRNNYDNINLRQFVEHFFDDFNDVNPTEPFNTIEKPAAKYVAHVWTGLTISDYTSFLKKNPNENVKKHPLYKTYRPREFTVEDFAGGDISESALEYAKKKLQQLEDAFWQRVIQLEKEKFYYFLLTFLQRVVLVKTGSKDAEKRFLGYEFSNRRGSEGIHPIQRGKTIEECTQLFDDTCFDNPEKASTYIYKAFNGDYDFPIQDSLKDNIFRVNLVDMITFDREKFDKTISLALKKKVKIESKWQQILFTDAITKITGSTEKIEKFNIKETGKYPVITQERGKLITGYSDNENPVADLPAVLFGDHSCTLKYIDFKFFRGADGTVLLKPKDNFLPKYFYYVLQYTVFGLIENKEKYERHYKYLQNLYVPLPPLSVQQKIVSEIEVMEKEESDAKEKIENLRKSIADILESKSTEQYKLSDILTLEYGAALPESNRVTGDFPVMGSNGIVGYHNAYLTEGPSIIVGRKGSAGKITWSNVNCFPIDTTFYVKLIDNQYNLKLVYYALQTANLESLSGGTGVPGLNRNAAYSKTIPLPPLSEQQKIIAEIEKQEAKIHDLQEQLTDFPSQKEMILKNYL